MVQLTRRTEENLGGNLTHCTQRELGGEKGAYQSVRYQQRGIQDEDVRAAISYGKRVPWFHGAVLYYLGNREMTVTLSQEPDLRCHADHLVGLSVLVNRSSGEVITAFKEKRGIHKIAQNYGGVRRKHTPVPSDGSDLD